MEAGVESGVGIRMEAPAAATLSLRLLGPLAVERAGAPVALPASRKVRALLAYLAMAGRPVSRAHLCELLWDLPSDPRGELRWCLSKLRATLDEPGRPRVLASGDELRLDVDDADVDARAIGQALQQGITELSAESLQALAARFGDRDFLEGLDLPRSPAFTGWVASQRRRLRAGLATVLEHWVRRLPNGSDAAIAALERWLAIAPYDRRAHEWLLDALAASGRLREGDAHLVSVERLFDAEGQDWAPIGHAWRAAKSRHARAGAPSCEAPARLLQPAELDPVAGRQRRASLAVMPFTELTAGTAPRGGIGDGLTHDIITRLAKLRSMFVIAPGTTFALEERRVDPEDAGRRLDVDYVASGSVRRDGGRLNVSVQLVETRSSRVLWADAYGGAVDDTFEVLETIGNRIVTAIESQIEVAERNRAILKAPSSLDAWEAYHRGLWHMVRFNCDDNEQARHFFQLALRLDPTFARPYAGLSFTHFQDAFLDWRERAPAIDQAYRIASQGLMVDDRDPSSHWALGRALWLQSRHEEGVRELEIAVDLSPNFALAHYTLAFVHAQTGDPHAAIAASDHSRALSPFDPMLFAMLATRALSLLRLGRHDEAADWAIKAASRPNAHVHIHAFAMHFLTLAGRLDEARLFAERIRRVQPGYTVQHLLDAFHLQPDVQAKLRRSAASIS